MSIICLQAKKINFRIDHKSASGKFTQGIPTPASPGATQRPHLRTSSKHKSARVKGKSPRTREDCWEILSYPLGIDFT